MRMTVLASGSKGNSTVIASPNTTILVDAGLSCRELLKRMKSAGEDPAALSAILITHEHQDHVSGLAVLARKLGIPVYLSEPTHRAWLRMMTPRTTMTYAQWLDKMQREKEARAAAIAAEASGIQSPHPSEPSGSIDLAAAADPDAVNPDTEDDLCDNSPAGLRRDPTFLPAVEYFHSGTNFSIGDISVTPFTIPHDAADPCGFVFESQGEHIRMAIATDLGYVPPNVKAALRRVDVMLLES
ncbi:MAG TPA: MBL fold metallo-hydrolase, partial [Acidobacteriaceae bacterium]|nr:MBL fold metallo-hydrolase [Acidobacteriaceae bacterium]